MSVPSVAMVRSANVAAAQFDAVRTVLEIGDGIAVKGGKHKHIRTGTTGQRVITLAT